MNYEEKGHDYQWEVVITEFNGYTLRVWCTYECLMPVGLNAPLEWHECLKEKTFAKGELMKALDNRNEWYYDDFEGPMMIGIREWEEEYMNVERAKILLNGSIGNEANR